MTRAIQCRDRVTEPDAAVTRMRRHARTRRHATCEPSARQPGARRFVRDQVDALRRARCVDVERVRVPARPRELPERGARAAAHGRLRRRPRALRSYRLAGARGSRGAKRAVTLHGTDVRHPRSLADHDGGARPFWIWSPRRPTTLAAKVRGSGRAARRGSAGGVDLDRFRRWTARESRARLGLDADAPLALFPADPARPEKRFDRAQEAAQRAGAQLLTLGHVPPDEVPLWVNAADVVLVPSDRGLRPRRARGAGVRRPGARHAGRCPSRGARRDRRDAVRAVRRDAWRDSARAPPARRRPRIDGRARATERWCADAMAQRVSAAWSGALYIERAAPGTGASRHDRA